MALIGGGLQFDQHREQLRRQASAPLLDELTDLQIKQLSRIYYASLLEEDEETRVLGFEDDDDEKQTLVFHTKPDRDTLSELVKLRLQRRDTFDEFTEVNEMMEAATRHDYARGKVNKHWKFEAESLLAWDGVNLRLRDSSPSWDKIHRELQAASIKAQEAKQKRNQGMVVETPQQLSAPIGEVSRRRLARFYQNFQQLVRISPLKKSPTMARVNLLLINP